MIAVADGLAAFMPPILIEIFGDEQKSFEECCPECKFKVLASFKCGIKAPKILMQVLPYGFEMTRIIVADQVDWGLVAKTIGKDSTLIIDVGGS